VSKHTEVKLVHDIFAQVFGIDPEALELAVALYECVLPRAGRFGFPVVVGVPARPLPLSCCARFASWA
jgi:hypothetical protein